MANQQLITYIRTQVASGAAMEAIRAALVGAGWAEVDVNEAVAFVNSESPAAPLAVKPAEQTVKKVETIGQPASIEQTAKPVASISPSVFQSAGISAAKPFNAAAQSLAPASSSSTTNVSSGPVSAFKVDEVVFRPESIAGPNGQAAPTTIAQMAPTIAQNNKSGGSRVWFFVAVFFILLSLASSGVAVFLYSENGNFQGRITSLSAQNARLADESGTSSKDRKVLDERIAALEEANQDLEDQISIFVLPTGGTGQAADRAITIRGRLDVSPAGYVLVTTRGIILQIKNSKDPKVESALKPFLGTVAKVDGVIVPGMREITFIGFMGEKPSEATPAPQVQAAPQIVPGSAPGQSADTINQPAAISPQPAEVNP